VEGLALMRRRRGVHASVSDAVLCRGPGNLAKAMGITLEDNRVDLCSGKLYIEDGGYPGGEIAWSPRIGIRVGTEHHWRAYVVGSPAVSGSAEYRIPNSEYRGPRKRQAGERRSMRP
jgi:DNA-3-methyladenine glycosylase